MVTVILTTIQIKKAFKVRRLNQIQYKTNTNEQCTVIFLTIPPCLEKSMKHTHQYRKYSYKD